METPVLFELRSYRAEPGRRDALIEMFETKFLDAYRAGGTLVLGTFRVPEEPDRWVWLRAFPDAASRGERLRRFYESDAWRRHGAACDALIREIEPARLLREWRPGTFRVAESNRGAAAAGVFVVDVHPVGRIDAPSFVATYGGRSARPIGAFLSDHSPNTYPRQPVRDDPAFVALTRFSSLAEAAKSEAPAGAQSRRLVPSARSPLR